MKSKFALILCTFSMVLMPLSAQDKSQVPPRQLTPATAVEVPSELAGMFRAPLTCDTNGNLYVVSYAETVDAIRKLDPNGKRLATFSAVTQPDIQVSFTGYYSVSDSGEVFVLVYGREINRWVFKYSSDGTLKSKIKLDPGFPFLPSQIAAFSNDYMLVSGQKMHSGQGPNAIFTGIFKPDGTLLKELKLDDDEMLRQLANSGDKAVSSPVNSSDNLAVSLGSLEIGGSGNAYLMRRLPSPIFYVISPAGDVTARFVVKTEKPSFVPMSMHVGQSRIAILFRDSDQRKQFLRVVDLTGKTISDYEENLSDSKQPLGPAFACFTEKPLRFTFLNAGKDHTLALRVAEGQ